MSTRQATELVGTPERYQDGHLDSNLTKGVRHTFKTLPRSCQIIQPSSILCLNSLGTPQVKAGWVLFSRLLLRRFDAQLWFL